MTMIEISQKHWIGFVNALETFRPMQRKMAYVYEFLFNEQPSNPITDREVLRMRNELNLRIANAPTTLPRVFFHPPGTSVAVHQIVGNISLIGRMTADGTTTRVFKDNDTGEEVVA